MLTEIDRVDPHNNRAAVNTEPLPLSSRDTEDPSSQGSSTVNRPSSRSNMEGSKEEDTAALHLPCLVDLEMLQDISAS